MFRDSWNWVGPPAWRGACFNSTEWRGGSSPVKTEPLLLLLFRTRAEARQCVCPQSLVPIGMGALDNKELFVIEGSQKTGAQLRDNPEEREKCGKNVFFFKKKNVIAAIPHWKRALSVSVANENVHQELSLRHFHCSRHNRRHAPAAPTRPAQQGHRPP